ncbi:MAG: AbrB/MazE/SpoVT family DNA-binding domain-containing protein [Bifidobacteriaceae bacterium]|jgi:AbrB family looped-hinge helix DNA binding protein|nr:AbrB/MazE/SpoVT family DNA-binding domain-containing protein [Bifidobacteriaceae bacterium]
MTGISTLTSKGQTTIPARERRMLGLRAGDKLVFTVKGDQMTVRKANSFVDLAGSVEVPEGRRGAGWDAIVEETRAARGTA